MFKDIRLCFMSNNKSCYSTLRLMSKIGLRFFLLLLVVSPLFFQGILFSQLESLYRSGTIKMVADSGFGLKTDWSKLFFDMNKSITIAPDGSLFISNNRQHNITKISASGQVLKTFGQKGMGTTDVNFPQRLSILDQKYLVVGENSTLRRISMFDLTGKFAKLLRTNHSCYSPVALKDNRIAYFSKKMDKKNGYKCTVWIKDIVLGKETEVMSVNLVRSDIIRLSNNSALTVGNHGGEMILERTLEGNLLVGISDRPDIQIYSSQGKFLHSFRVNITPLPITNKYTDAYKQAIIEEMSIGQGTSGLMHFVKKTSFANLFPTKFPYYRNIMVDSKGNILIFKWLDCVKECPVIFQAYSAPGAFIKEVQLDMGPFALEISSLWQNLIFTERGLFAYVQIKGDEDCNPKIIKIKVPANSK